MGGGSGQDLDPIAALAEPVRRRLYEYVVGQGVPVDRDEAAVGVGIGRPLAAFHLDRLAEAGLLDVTFRRRSGRSGPGAGRPAKFYLRPPGRDVRVSLPPRQYDLAAELLAEGVEPEADARVRVLAAARARGAAIARSHARPDAAGTPAGTPPDARLLALLEGLGYEPFRAPDGALRLRNCPFHALVDRHRALTCSMNLALLEGMAASLGDGAPRPVADPGDTGCCVAFAPADGNSLAVARSDAG